MVDLRSRDTRCSGYMQCLGYGKTHLNTQNRSAVRATGDSLYGNSRDRSSSISAVLTGEALQLATSVTSFFFFSGFSLSCGVAAMAVDYLHPRLEYVATHDVHVSIAGSLPPGRWSSLLSSSSYVCHQYPIHYVLFVPSHHSPMTPINEFVSTK